MEAHNHRLKTLIRVTLAFPLNSTVMPRLDLGISWRKLT
jgi:hypothetical protein